MIHSTLEAIGNWIIEIQKSMGYGGIVLLMGIESACIPLPSELIMPFAGYLVSQGVFSIWSVTLAGAVGCVIGGWVAYFIGSWGGRPFINKYGKYILLNSNDVLWAEQLFNKHGEIIAFTSRLLPVIRTFIALPAGILKMNFWKFTIYSFLGSLPFCFALTYVGLKMGENWPLLKEYFHKADLVIGAVILVGGIFWIKHHILFLKSSHRSKKIQ